MKFSEEKNFQIALNDFQKIKLKMMPFPMKNFHLITRYQKQLLSKNIKCIDPSGIFFLQMLQQYNKNQVMKIGREIQNDIIQLIESSYSFSHKLQSLCFLKKQIEQIVNKRIKGINFQLDLFEQNPQKQMKEKDQKQRIFKQIVTKISYFYQINVKKQEKQKDQCQIIQSNESILQKIYQSKIQIQSDQNQEIRQLDKQAASLHFMLDKEVAKKYANSNEMKKKHFIHIPLMVSNKKEEIIKQKYLNFIPNHYLHRVFRFNLQNSPNLSVSEVVKIKQLMNQSLIFMKQYLQNKFTKRQINKIFFSLRKSITNQRNHLVGQQTYAWKIKQKCFDEYSCILEKVISGIKTLQFPDKNAQQKYNPYLVILILFYTCLNDKCKYNSLIKNYLQKICQILEAKATNIYLRGALKIIQNHSINPSRLSIQLASLPPQRWSEHQLSKQSRLQRNNYLAKDPKRVKLKIDKYVKQNQSKQMINKIIPEIQFVKLNYSSSTKVVTIAISGFGSQDTCKYLQWKGLVEDFKDTQLYSLYWKSSTQQQIKNYLKQLGINVFGSLITTTSLLLFIMKAAANMIAQNKLNPFTKAINWSKQTGFVLADFIIDNFSDRFIILIGFSLGTMVIYYCLQRLSSRGRLDLIHKIVTLGGVADQQNIYNLLHEAKFPLHWTNIESDQDWTVKYLYKIYSLGKMPIGAGGLRPISGHELINLQVGKVIDGHTQFRCFLRGLMRMIGLNHN